MTRPGWTTARISPISCSSSDQWKIKVPSPSLEVLNWSRHLSSNNCYHLLGALWPVILSCLRSPSMSWPPHISSDTAVTPMAGVSTRAKHERKLNCRLIPRSDRFILGSKYASRAQRGSSTLWKMLGFQGCQGSAVNKD